jgi:Tfp pilus assembly protein PilF
MDRIASIKKMLESTPNDSFLQHALAMEHSKLGDDATARQLYETILTREPGYIGSYYQLGQLLERTGENVLAAEWYDRGMQAAKAAGDNKAFGELRSALEELVG